MPQAPSPIYLKDYRPADYKIEAVDLRFDLDPARTTVSARLVIERRGGVRGAPPIILDGQDITLLSINLDGQELEPNDYTLSAHQLTIDAPPANFVLEINTTCAPQKNTALEGLYRSGNSYITQCEAEGFRKITYFLDRPDNLSVFQTEIVADREANPVLLSNGNLVEHNELPNGRHRALWHDPFPKPSYLFALVAGKFTFAEDHFTTMSGRDVILRIYVEPGNEDRCDFAMESLKKSMRWDEEKFGLEYDLDMFMIVAASDFNMGAMENKGLNVFNAKYVLANPETATDADYANIEAIIAHEYLHNWTGNRVTCRDWFQLSLKEGLTVFRDQEFSADMRSAGVKRISDVRMLRARQFPEDSGPLAHPVQPKSYLEINNFYTATVYEKGAEIIRMIQVLIGPENFRNGMDLYIDRHDGKAATIEDFVGAIADASGVDLSRFRRWYDQAGTPRIAVQDHYDADTQTYEITVSQNCPATPGEQEKQALVIPLAMGLLDSEGNDLPLHLEGADDAPTTRVLQASETTQTFHFTNVPEAPTPSLLRGFSAPVIVDPPLSRNQQAFLMAHDSDPFNRWESGQQFAVAILLDQIKAIQRGEKTAKTDAYITAIENVIASADEDKALTAQMLALPSEEYLATKMQQVDVKAIHQSREALRLSIAQALRKPLTTLYHSNVSNLPYSPGAEEAGRRRLRNAALEYLVALDEPETTALCAAQYVNADNMTDRIAALDLLANLDCPERTDALANFYDTWQQEPIVTDKWLSIQAMSTRPDTLENVISLLDHDAFSMRNPNRVRALIGAFCNSNQLHFHAVDGRGYAFLVDQVLRLDPLNPQVAARLLSPLGPWRRFDGSRQALMKAQLQRVLDTGTRLSMDVYEIASKSLA